MKNLLHLFALSMLMLSVNAANAANYPTIVSSPVWGGPAQHHVDLIMAVGDYVPEPDPSTSIGLGLDGVKPLYVPLVWEALFRPDPANPWVDSSLPGDVEPVLQILKPDGSRVPIVNAQVVTCQKPESLGYYSLYAGQTCWLRARVDTRGPIAATLTFPLNSGAVLQAVRASIEVKDINEKPLARAELR